VPLTVIGGEARGRKLRSPPGPVRPTAAILRRSLFDILGPRVAGARVLDLYAGAGTLGIEAISRGAAFCDFVERDRRCANVIAENLALADAGARGRVHRAGAEAWLERHLEVLLECGLIFLDPPYGDPGLMRILRLLAVPDRLRPDALVVVEDSSRGTLAVPAGLSELRRVAHGDSALTLLEPRA